MTNDCASAQREITPASTAIDDAAAGGGITRRDVFALPVLIMAALVLLTAFVTSASAQWAATGTMNTPRTGHTATLLPSGKVLVAGSSDSPNLTASAELFDPVTETWSITGSLTTARGGHSAVLLNNGKVLIFGGFVAGAELYDPATGTFSPTGGLRTPRVDASSTLLADGKVLVVGGGGSGTGSGTLRSSEVYDPATETWQDAGNLNVARLSHAAVRLNDGRVLVAGGADCFNEDFCATATDTAEIYDPAIGTWSAIQRIAIARWGLASTLLANGKALIVGGVTAWPVASSYATSEVYDPVAGWSRTGDLNVARFSHTATLLPNGDVLVTGGFNYPAPEFLSSAEQYSAATGTWSLVQSMSTTRVGHTATRLVDGRVLVAGGHTQSLVLASAELYGTAAAPQVNIGPGFTGSWYDPAQSGHGLFIEVLPGNRMLVAWFAFSPGGGQSWFLGVGNYSGNTATIAAVDQPAGGRWIPNFDATKIVHNAWGSLTLTFTDCNHGRVDFNSTLGYGTGSMNLTRLTQVAGLSCTTIQARSQ